MSEAATDSSGTKPSTKKLPDVPQENSLLHIVLEYRKQLRLDLVAAGLLDVAEKRTPPQCAAIQDFDLAPIIARFPAPGDRNYLTALQFRLQKEKENRENAVKRANIEMTLRTELYTALVSSCAANAKALGDEIVETCAYSSVGRAN